MTGIKKPILYFFPTALFLFFSIILSAQPVSNPYYNFKNLTTADGLLSNAVHSVFKDTRGFLWIGTDRGLQRYNGSTFLNFRHLNADSNSIESEFIGSLKEDCHNNIWICTMEGITKFDYRNGRLTNFKYGYKNNNPIKLEEVFCFFEDSKGRAWIGTRGAGLFLFDTLKQQFNHFAPARYFKMKQALFHYVARIYETKQHELIFSVVDGFVTIDSCGNQQYLHVPEPEEKRTTYLPCFLLPLLKEHPDEIWLSSNSNGFFKYNRIIKQWTNYHLPDQEKGAYISSAFTWSENEWYFGFGYFSIYNHRTGIFTSPFKRGKIKNINNIYRDDEGNMWMPSSSSGLLYFNTATQLFSAAQTIPEWRQNRIMYFDSSAETIYSVPPYSGAKILNFNVRSNTVSHDSIAGFIMFKNVVNNFIQENDILYLATWSGMYKYDLQKHLLDSIVYRNGTLSSMRDGFFDVCKSANKIYFSGRMKTGGPFEYDKITHKVTDLELIFQKDTINLSHSYSLAFTDHTLYVGSSLGDSIYSYNEINRKKNAISIPASYTIGGSKTILCMCIDNKQNLWCGTVKNGICVFNIPTQKWITHIGQQEGFFPSSFSQIICDENGNIWCNSYEGLYVFNNSNFLFSHFTVNDGLLVESEGGWLTKMPDHRLAYSNLKDDDDISFGIINTKSFRNTVQTIPISISDLKILGNPFLSDTLLDNVQQVTLPPNHNALSLNYAGLHITEGKSLLYTYLLEGAEKKWHDAGGNQNLSYVNLAPGKYILHIKCKSRDEKIISKERLLYITLLPAWYQTWWFKLISIFASSFLLYFAIRYYLNQKIKKQQAVLENEKNLAEERYRIASDMHDDVGAGLSRIRYITTSMKGKQSLSEDDINKIISLSDESVEKMNEIIWSLNQGSQQLDELIYYIRGICSEMVNNAGLEFEFIIPTYIPSKVIAWKDCRNIYLLVKEAVNNAVKHASAKEISICFEINESLLIVIKDDGVGFSEDNIQRHGNGLPNYKKRVEGVHGTLTLISSNGNGTELRINIPMPA